MNIEPGYYKLRITMHRKDDSIEVTYIDVAATSSAQLAKEIAWAKSAYNDNTIPEGVRVTYTFVRSFRDRKTDRDSDYLE